MDIPAQAIPCALHNVKPIGKNRWTIDHTKQFLKKVLDKSFAAVIRSVDKQVNNHTIIL